MRNHLILIQKLFRLATLKMKNIFVLLANEKKGQNPQVQFVSKMVLI